LKQWRKGTQSDLGGVASSSALFSATDPVKRAWVAFATARLACPCVVAEAVFMLCQ
jgi:hypothetical protein